MATVTRKPKSVKPARPADLVVSLALSIDHQVYLVTPIRAELPEVLRAWRLAKRGADGAVYDVAVMAHGFDCTCPDFECRRKGLDAAGCKHCKALVRVGLLDAPAPDPAPVEWIASLPSVPDESDAPAPCCPADEPAPCQACLTEAPAIAPACCVCDQCRTCADAIADHAEAWTGDPLPAAEARLRGAVMSGHEPDPDEDWGDPESWPDWTDNWFFEPNDQDDLDDATWAAREFGRTTRDYDVVRPAGPDRQAIRRGRVTPGPSSHAGGGLASLPA